MASPQENLADALEALKTLQDKGMVAIRSGDLARSHRERLTRSGFLKPVIKGWYIPSRPEETGADETTSWYASYWDFCASYLNHRFGEKWSLSPEQSVLFHARNRIVPKQLLIRSPKARNKITNLAHGSSILEIRAQIAEHEVLEEIDGLRAFKLPNALVVCGARFFHTYPVDARAALSEIRDASELLAILLEGGHSTIAGRLAGALRNIGRGKVADEIIKTMRTAGYNVNETDPFEDKFTISLPSRTRSAYVNRLYANWQSMRENVIQIFPKPPGIPSDVDKYLKDVDDIYVTDAYHSLSIEGYRVNEALIERVRAGSWNPDDNKEDREQCDAMAARGYWLAFNEVKKSVEKILNKHDAGEVTEEDHRDWHRALFSPSVDAGILNAGDLAGYRNGQVYISRSQYVPLNCDAVRDCMPEYFELLREETEPQVRVVLGHSIFVYIHPYMDGNGRMGRFLMNAMLASGGYPWTVIPVERRDNYMQALEEASVNGNIVPFTEFLAGLVSLAKT